MEAAGVGTHPVYGHAAVLRRVGASILHGATMGKLPQIFHDNDVHASVETAEAKAAREKSEADLKAQNDVIAGLKTQIADLQAAAAKGTTVTDPQRKTVSRGAQALLSKFNVKEGEQVTAANVDEILKGRRRPAGRSACSIEAKLKLRQEGLLN